MAHQICPVAGLGRDKEAFLKDTLSVLPCLVCRYIHDLTALFCFIACELLSLTNVALA